MSSTKSTSSSWFTIPEPVRAIFDKFPLQTYPAAPITPSITFPCNEAALAGRGSPDKTPKRTMTLYVHNLADTQSSKGSPFLLPTDPTSVEILGYLRLKEIKFEPIDGEPGPIRMLAVSPHSAPHSGNLPYLIDISQDSQNPTKKTRAVYSTPGAVYRNLLEPVPAGEPALYRSMVSTVLHDAWVFMLIDPETPVAVRQKILGEGPYRVPPSDKQVSGDNGSKSEYTPLPEFVENYLADSYTLALAEELRPRYPAVVEFLKERSWKSVNLLPFGPTDLYKKVRQVQRRNNGEAVDTSSGQRDTIFSKFLNSGKGGSVRDDIYLRTTECLQVFVSLIEESGSEHGEIHGDGDGNGFIGIGGRSEVNGDVREFKENEMNVDGGLGPLDVMLFAYIYSIVNYAKGTRLQQLVSEQFPELVKHSENVYDILF